MKVCVLGMWHLGSVTAACLSTLGHETVGFDPDPAVVEKLRQGAVPVAEPGLSALVKKGMVAGVLSFTADLQSALKGASVAWVAYDTPVDDDDRADVAFVSARIKEVFPFLADGATVVISSQMPVGSTRAIEDQWLAESQGRRVTFVYSPENLRLGKAIDAFLGAERIIVGARTSSIPAVIEMLGPLSERVIWMSVESAEMTKHALNAFLALSVTFINELAVLCESVGADAKQVERGLKTDVRIGPKAYLGPGAAFAGGTLARDVEFLRAIGEQQQRPTALLDGLADSNSRHREWPINRIAQSLGEIAGSRIAVWGLTYKPGTNTLRRSDSVQVCNALVGRGATVVAHDPTVRNRPGELHPDVRVASTAREAAAGADVLLIATAWPEYQAVDLDDLFAALKQPVVIDASRALGDRVAADRRFRYLSVGSTQ